MAKQRYDSMRFISLFNSHLPSVAPAATISATVMSLVILLLPAVAQAQNPSMQLLYRVERLQRDVIALQLRVYKGQRPPVLSAVPLPPVAGDLRNAGRNLIRITQIENELQKLTGRIEEMGFRTEQIQARLEKLVSDMDRRLAALEGGTQSGTVSQSAAQSSSLSPSISTPASAQAPAPVRRPPAVPAPSLLRGAAPGILGTTPKHMAVSSPRGPANAPPVAPAAQKLDVVPASVLPEGTPKAQYDYALSILLKQQDFAKAEEALKAFIYMNPKDPLMSNAHYWLGQTFYVRKNFQAAAFAFADGFQQYPKGIKAPDSLLKLGMSLGQLEKHREACTTYSQLLATFPTMPGRLKSPFERERKKSKCR